MNKFSIKIFPTKRSASSQVFKLLNRQNACIMQMKWSFLEGFKVLDGENDNEIQMKVSMAGLWFEDKQTFFP